MAKMKSSYVCQNCGAKRSKWEGRCSDCQAWNTFVEEKSTPISARQGWVKGTGHESSGSLNIYNLEDCPEHQSGERISTGIAELDRVLGGGLVIGSYILLGGDPGIGKSTLVMQMAGGLSAQNHKVLYLSAEESVQQTSLRARRLGVNGKNVSIASESSLDLILEVAMRETPEVLIIDSIQTVFTSDVESAPGSVSQVRECAAKLLALAKTKNISVVLIGHVTKDGSLAGPRVLEHMVDTVLAFEGDNHQMFRLLRALKNRFGATNELGVFQMSSDGLTEISNPSQFFLEERKESRFGSAVFAALEGSRPLLCEIQALTNSTGTPSPRRTSVGIDINRVHMLLAVLDKHTQLSFSNRDVYANVVGGLKLNEPASDLALASALISSECEVPVPANSCYVGEVGLTGEVRACNFAEERVKEAIKLGFTQIFLPESNRKNFASKNHSATAKNLVFIKHIRDLEQLLAPGGRPDRRRKRPPGETEITFDAEP